MILLADSGSTKTDWVAMHEGKVVVSFRTAGLNPYYITIDEGVRLLRQAFDYHIEPDAVGRVFFYGAGCMKASRAALIKEILQEVLPGKAIEVASDLLAASRALFDNRKGIACILGTGASVCSYNGQQIHEHIPSLGYLFGDEGSGAHLGKTYIDKHLRGLILPEVTTCFDQEIGLSNEEILTQLYNHKSPNRFLASFAPFIRSQIQHPEIHQLVNACFQAFFRTQLMKLQDWENHEIGMVGSVACHFSDLLHEAAHAEGLKIQQIIRSPIEGLMRYHAQSSA